MEENHMKDWLIKAGCTLNVTQILPIWKTLVSTFFHFYCDALSHPMCAKLGTLQNL